MEHIVTCHQTSCVNAEQPIRLWLEPEVSAVVCGPCGRQITDVVPPLPVPEIEE